MIGLGTTLRCNLPPRHIWVVLSDPDRAGGEILMVNLTTLTEECVDDACVLGPADYSLLMHETAVAYSRAQAGGATVLESLIHEGSFTIVDAVPRPTLERILNGALQTRELSAALKRLVTLPDRND